MAQVAPSTNGSLPPPVVDPTDGELTALREEQLASLYAISVEIAGLHHTSEVMDRALEHCLRLTESAFGFVGLVDAPDRLDVAAIKGFVPDDDTFWERLRSIPIRPSVFGIVVIEGRSRISNDVHNDQYHVGAPRGHPPVRTFLGVPLRFRDTTIGMIGVANRAAGYAAHHERLLTTFANQVAVAIANARMYEQQQAMIADLRALHRRLDDAQLAAMLHDERSRIAEGLHDRVAQIMFSIGISANTGLERLDNPALVTETLERIRELASRGSSEIRRTVYDLSSGGQVAPGLVTSLRELVRAYDCEGATRVTLTVHGRPRRLPSEVERVMLQVAGEALLNIQRHAQARAAVLALRFGADHAELAIQDDGVGAPPEILRGYRGNRGHFGLNVMAHRVEAVGGSLRLETSDDGGLSVTARIPCVARDFTGDGAA